MELKKHKPKKTLANILADIWRTFLKVLGLCLLSDHEKQCSEIVDECEKKILDLRNAYQEKMDVFEKDLEDIKRANEEVQYKYTRALEQVVRYREIVPMENLAAVKSYQKQLSEYLHDTTTFGFPSSRAIPGSVAMSSAIVHADEHDMINCRLRLIATDEETTLINQEPDMRIRYKIMLDILRKRGLYEKIAEHILYDGGASMSMAYNNSCTNYELYIDMAVKVLPNAGTIRDLGAILEEIPPDKK